MNYYEHHLGDYMRDTAHLSILEDGAYRRLLDAYYARERALPVAERDCCKLARAVSKPERDAVAYVLKEFFELREDGHHQRRADREIARYLANEPEREAKKANEENRTRRHREERARLFQVITQAGGHAVWNAPIADLRAMADRIAGAEPVTPVTAPVTPPVTPSDTQNDTAPAMLVTATHTHSPYPLPIPIQEEPSGSSVGAASRRVATRRLRIPDDFAPNEAGMRSAEAKGLDIREELQRFSDYHRGRGSLMADWQAAWRTWVSNARVGPRLGSAGHASLSEAGARTAAAAREAKAMLFGGDA